MFMRVLKNDDYKLLERLVSLSQAGMHKVMKTYLQSKYEKVIVKEKYIVAIGNIPIALVAHMDTVFKYPVDNMYYDDRKGVIWSPEGLGADDRAGIFAIIQILKSGLRPSVILTTDEENGGIGAAALAGKKCPIPNLKYMIQLDRRGTNDCVFYDCYNPSFIEYVESFGFVERWGSFSDISVLMPAWKICGVNLSVGYEDEHSISETLHIKPLFNTIEKVKNMLKVENIPTFAYEELKSHWYQSWGGISTSLKRAITADDDYGAHCASCKKLFSEYEMYPVKAKGQITKLFCPDCVVDQVDWCPDCGEAYEINSSPHAIKCNDCAEKEKQANGNK
jgi:hypothetical protein